MLIRMSIVPGKSHRRAFTLIELLIVVAIIAVLAAIAVPNFLEAQTRANVSRVKADLRTIATGVEAYRVDHGLYPEGTDNPLNFPQEISDVLGDLAPGYYAFRTRDPNGAIAGQNGFFTLTTPIAYIHAPPPLDPFATGKGTTLPYCYRPGKELGEGYILTSVGPDRDLFAPDGRGNDNAANPYSTAADGNSPARIADINERQVIHAIEGTGSLTGPQRAQMKELLKDLAYDPTNGTTSDGDIYRLSGSPKRVP